MIPLLGLLLGLGSAFGAQDVCTDNWLKTNPALAARFSRGQIDMFCDRTAAWTREATAPQEFSFDDTITRNQKNWLASLRGCSGKECVQDAVDARCRGRRCLAQPKALPLPTTAAPHNIGLAKSPPSAAVDIEAGFTATNVRSLDHRALLASLDDDIPSTPEQQDELVQGRESKLCQEKLLVSSACPAFLQATRVRQVLPGLLDGSSKTALALRKKFGAFKRKCTQIRNELRRRSSESFGTLRECGDAQGLGLQRQATSKACTRVLQASRPRQAFPDMALSTTAQRRAGQRRFRAAKASCLELQGKLSSAGSSFDEWLSGGLAGDDNRRAPRIRGGRRRPDGASDSLTRPRSRGRLSSDALDFDDAGGLDFDDIDNVDFRAERLEYRMMSEAQRLAFHTAMQRLKSEKIDDLSKYDLLVIYHTPQESPGAHWGPAFLPFHRELLKQLEVALRQLDSSVALPYWDSTLDEGLPTAADSVIWSEDFFGNGDGIVTTGPYANWTTTHELSFVPGMRKLFRGVGESQFGGQFKEADIEFVMTRESFPELTACVDPTFELVHGLVHMFVGGFMADIAISPNDPAFFLHHNFIDSLWEEWRLRKQTFELRESDFPADAQSCNNFHYKSSKMLPFAIENGDGLSNDYTREIYYHSPRPTCTAAAPDCGSTRLFCSQKGTEPRCLSKVRFGGDCTGFEGTDVCYQSTCVAGRCAASQDSDVTRAPAVTTQMPTTTTTRRTTTTPTTKAPVTQTECDESRPCAGEQFCDLEWSQCLFKFDLGEECAGFEGLGPCRGGAECQNGFCVTPFEPECTNLSACPAGFFCDTLGQECVEQIPLGDFCNEFEGMAGVCTAPGECQGDTCVDPTVTTTTPRATTTTQTRTTTKPPMKDGADCSSDADCGSAAFCDVEYSVCMDRFAIGDGCEGFETFSRACADGSECVDSYCKATRMATTTAAPASGPCSASADCPAANFCDVEYSLCTAQIPNGGPCEGMEAVADVCADGGTCQDNVCQPPAELGPCTTSAQCPTSHFCDTAFSRCQTRIPTGDLCEGYEGVSDACVDSTCVGGTCLTDAQMTTTVATPPTTTIGVCASSADCAEGSFCDVEYGECLLRNMGGADCTGFEAFADACVDGLKCLDGTCKSGAPLKETESETEVTTTKPVGTCSASVDCEPGDFCDIEFGECLGQIPVEEPCELWEAVDDVCADGAQCLGGVCTAVVTGECDAARPCPGDLFCDTQFNECADKINIGDSCAGLGLIEGVCMDGGLCEDGLCVAAAGPATTTTTMTPILTTVEPSPDYSCTVDEDCDGPDYFCDSEFGECLLRFAEGESCEGLEIYPQACLAGLECRGASCVKPQETMPSTTAAPECRDNIECGEGDFCHLVSGVCLPFVPVGGPCPPPAEAFQPCVTGAQCIEDTCVVPAQTTTLKPTMRPTTPAPCTRGSCSEGSFCDIEYGECVPVFRKGEICSGFETNGDVICVEGTTCELGRCEAPVVITTTTTTQVPTTTTTTTQPTTTTTTTTQPTTTTTRRPTTTTTMRTTTQPPTTTTGRRYTTQPIRPDEGGESGGEEAAPFPVVYFTVSVIRGNINFYKQPVPGASVKTTGKNVPSGYTQALSGETSLSSSYPYYTGAAVVRVMDPKRAGYFPLVQAEVDVVDEMGRPCAAMCYQAAKAQYVSCSNTLRLSTNSYYSDPVLFKATKQEALEAGWQQDGYYRKRLPDYMLFQC